MTKDEARTAFVAGVELIELESCEPHLSEIAVAGAFEAWWKARPWLCPNRCSPEIILDSYHAMCGHCMAELTQEINA